MSGPLHGIRVLELAGSGPGPFCSMLLADLGAQVIRVQRPSVAGGEVGIPRPPHLSHDLRSRHIITLDLKDADARSVFLGLVAGADALIEVFRPGVAERLGIGPDDCLAVNQRLVYGRMTGWGQDGPMAARVGHDLNYIGLTGVLDAIGRKGAPPTPPLNLVGDYGGGALYLALGIVAALYEAQKSGTGQVIDASIVDGTVSLSALFLGFSQQGEWGAPRGTNSVDSGAPDYDVYECSDGKYMAFAPIEERFYLEALRILDLDSAELPSRHETQNWDDLKSVIGAVFKTQTRDYWTERFEGVDACVTPVLDLKEAQSHPHLRDRRAFMPFGEVLTPAPAPRFSRTVPDDPQLPTSVDPDSAHEVLGGWLDRATIQRCLDAGHLVERR
jgi:alpha-methylacyl-CoA racemase